MAYNQFAYVYDELMHHAPYEKWLNFTRQMIQKRNCNVHTIVDLGCGTGEIATRLASLGYLVFGVDFSTEMLTCATRKAMDRKVSVNWIKQDITNLTGFTDVDLFISYCDVLNYVTDLKDVQKVFERVYDSLRASGLFIFDIHNVEYAEKQLMNHTFTDVTDELAYIWDCEEGDTFGEMYHHLTFFKKDREKYIRFDELHHQQTHDISIYENLLKSCGFNEIQFYGDFLIENGCSIKNSERIFIVAEK